MKGEKGRRRERKELSGRGRKDVGGGEDSRETGRRKSLQRRAKLFAFERAGVTEERAGRGEVGFWRARVARSPETCTSA
eukprot:2974349-Pleurochrysis_carterae.AAC.1